MIVPAWAAAPASTIRLCAFAAGHAYVCSQKHFSGGHGGARTRSDAVRRCVFTPPTVQYQGCIFPLHGARDGPG
eukprot:5387542-Prymnesium_polylepis.1